MKMKRSSWHYKINEKIGYHEKDYETLCSYFWKTVVKIVWGGTLLSASLGIAYLLIFEVSFYNKIVGLIILTLFFSSALLPPISIMKIRKVRLTRAYIKAVKDKVCPIIFFVD